MSTELKPDRFPVVKRGYEPEAVENHLRTAADEYDQTLDEAAAQIAGLETQLAESRKYEEAVHLTILAATKTKEDMLEVAQHQANEVVAASRKQGNGIVADARMQAFQVVTEARKEADGVVAEARVEVAALRRTLESSAATKSQPSESETALQERIEELQNVIAAMESELRSPAGAALRDSDGGNADQCVDAQTGKATVAPSHGGPAAGEELHVRNSQPSVPTAHPEDEQRIEIVVNDAKPSVQMDSGSTVVSGATDRADAEPSIDDRPAAREGADEEGRRSFYSRRSANLPRIGAEAGRSAMAAAAGLRTGVTSNAARNNTDQDRSEALETV